MPEAFARMQKTLSRASPEGLYGRTKSTINERKQEMKFGLYTICEFGDSAPEPEGTVIYNELPPKVGTEVILSDKKTWIVTRFEEYNSTVYVEIKTELESERNQK